MRVVAALGGNALLRRGEPQTWPAQQENARRAAASLAQLLDAGHGLIVTHGNGPQVGLLALQAAGRADAPPVDVLDAETEGMIGYLIEQQLREQHPEGLFATLLTQVEVDAADPAFSRPEKPIGPVYPRGEAERLARAQGWRIAPDGTGWRRVIASPRPLRILPIEAIRLLADAGLTVICAGGGGIPVVRNDEGGWEGVAAVIDKDRASALLAVALGADALLLLTDVDGVYRHFGRADAARLDVLRAADAASLDLPPGSMGPKVEAALAFAAETGALAVIGALDAAGAMLDGRAGTRIVTR